MDMTSFLLGYKSGLKSGGDQSSYITQFLTETTFTNSAQSFDDVDAFAYFVPVKAEVMGVWATNSKPVTVVYDGEGYSLTPQTINYTDDIAGVCVGNLALFGGAGNNEPFAVASWQNDTEPGFLFISTVDTAPTQHTVRIYQNKISDSIVVGDNCSLNSYTPFPRKTLTFTTEDNALWKHTINGKAFNLVEGETYFVYWYDSNGAGSTYTLTAKAGIFNGSPGIGLGNEALANSEAEGTGSVLIYVLDDGSETGFYTSVETSSKQVEIEYVRVDDNLRFATAAFSREAEWVSGDATVFVFNNFIRPDGGKLGSVAPYAFAGFGDVKKMKINGAVMYRNNAFAGNSKLKILDLTPADDFPSIWFSDTATLNGCTSLEAIIVRPAESGLDQVAFMEGSTSGSNSTFYLYVPSEYYDAIVQSATAGGEITANRIRKLEDCPEIGNWYDEWLASRNN